MAGKSKSIVRFRHPNLLLLLSSYSSKDFLVKNRVNIKQSDEQGVMLAKILIEKPFVGQIQLLDSNYNERVKMDEYVV